MMTRKPIALGGLAVALVVGCTQVLGLKDPTLEEVSDARLPDDATLDAPLDAPSDMGPAGCVPANCPFGCDPDTNACRPAKLFVFLTTGAFFGDGFVGSPPDVRGTADARCFDTFSTKHQQRACTRARTHAIISVAGADSIQEMASTYGIPTGAPVHRIDDDLLVFASWNELIDSTKAPRAAVASAASASTDADGTFWSGFNAMANASNCVGWTTRAVGSSGAVGHSTTDNGSAPGVTWLGQNSTSCNFLHRLLCVCWTGGT